MDEVESAVERATRDPELYPITRRPAIRTVVMRGFPHSIHYRVRQGAIQVLAVAHHSRRPGYWLGRLRR